MSNCASCGAVLGIGRYCTNCGARVDDPAPPVAPPGSGHPLYADEVQPADEDDRRRGLPWLVLLLAGMLIAVVVGAWLVLGGDEEPLAGGDPAATPTEAGPTDTGPASSAPPAEDAGPPRDLREQARVQAPRHAPAGQDFAGRRVAYPPGNMLDGRPQTAYRVDGDATGTVITFTLPERRTVTRVGLINGYAKTDRDRAGNEISWYPRQHRITRVAWVFDDGSRFVQSLRMTRALQELSLSVETRTIELHVLETRGPGDINRARDATSISEVRLQGS